jgi:hypothetical protein
MNIFAAIISLDNLVFSIDSSKCHSSIQSFSNNPFLLF